MRMVTAATALAALLLCGCSKQDEAKAKQKAHELKQEVKKDLHQAGKEIEHGLHEAKKELHGKEEHKSKK